MTAADATMVIKLGYQGQGFCGFAAQPDQRTVAGELQQALETYLRRPVEITCAGRTDTGVHAQAQYISLPVAQSELSIPYYRLQRGLTALTPKDISIKEIYRADKDFSARFSACARHYRYRIAPGAARPILSQSWSWWTKGELDLDAMQKGANYLIGEHDFKSFCKAASAIDKPTHRFVESCNITRTCEVGEPIVAIDICGNAFLHSMVRTITGTLVEVGRGHKDPSWVGEVLAAKDRCAAGPCAPAQGLCFVAVDYPDHSFIPWGE